MAQSPQAFTPKLAFGQSMLFGQIRLMTPDWTTSITDHQVPLINYNFSIARPGIYFTSFLYLGLGLSAYWICKNILYKGYRGFIKYIKTWGNSAKFLSSDSPKDEQGKKLKYTAVIYGASTKVGRAYAHYLIRFGFNLILVERDRNQLDDIEADLKKDSIYDVKITKIVLDKFDQDTLNKQLVNPLKEHKNSPVKLFINCKNSRRKIQTENSQMEQHTQAMQDSLLEESLILDQSKLNDSQRNTLAQLWQPTITREEVFFTGKENIEGFVCLLSYFLPQMVSTDVDYPALINIDNHDFENTKDTRAGQLFFQSVINFKDTFTKNLPMHVRNKVKSITLKVDFNNIPTSSSQDMTQSICNQVFDNLGLSEVVFAKLPKLRPKNDE